MLKCNYLNGEDVKFTELWHKNAVSYWYSGLISHTQKHTQHTQEPAIWHTHINIYLHHLLFAYSRYFYYIKWLNE